MAHSTVSERASQDSSTLRDASAYDILCDVRDAAGRNLIADLCTAGFNDVPKDALLVLYAMRLGGDTRMLIRQLGIDGRTVGNSIQTLIRHGYLELQNNPDNPRNPRIIFTDRGHAALDETDTSVRAYRWTKFPFRSGDIVINSTPKSGTTWVQMICALLIFQTPKLPAALPKLSPWMEAQAGEHAELAAQQHRRFIKSHLPLDKVPNDPRVTYIVVARDPLDIAVSWHHQKSIFIPANRRAQPSGEQQATETARQWLLGRIDEMGTFPHGRDSYFDALLKSLYRSWERRADSNVVLVHYEDLSADLPGEMRRLAKRLGLTIPEDKWPALVQAATFKQMQADADHIRPLEDQPRRDVRKGHAAFFRRGSSGEGRALLTEDEAAQYYSRAAQVVPQELLAWLHRTM